MSDGTVLRHGSVVVATRDDLVAARATVRGLLAQGSACTVVDLGGGYRSVADETVVAFTEAVDALGTRPEASLAAITLTPGELSLYAGALGACWVLRDAPEGAVVVVGAGVWVLTDLTEALRGVSGSAVLRHADADIVVRRALASGPLLRSAPDGVTLSEGHGSVPLLSRAMVVLDGPGAAARLRSRAASWQLGAVALEAWAVEVGADVIDDPCLLLSPWRAVSSIGPDDASRLQVSGRAVAAVDLTEFDPHRPWLLTDESGGHPAVLLSEHAALAAAVAAEARVRRDDEILVGAAAHADAPPAAGLVSVGVVLREGARRAHRAGSPLPDVLAVDGRARLDEWAVEPVPARSSDAVGRYLMALREIRPDLREAFARVPGPDSASLATWALRHGVEETGVDVDLLRRAAEATAPSGEPLPTRSPGGREPGVNLVGYLAGELGLGESARLVDDALSRAGVATTTIDVSPGIDSRRGAAFRHSDQVLRRTSLLCVNAPETGRVVAQLAGILRRTRVVGMWYWELADVPRGYPLPFSLVDEVWVATDFVRAAIAPHAGDTPVRTVMPPLPQASGDAGAIPGRLGLPTDRPFFLFTFDFLSEADRKNPYGLVEAFVRAFADRDDDARPLLVIKTINAERRPGDAERLRLQIATLSDVVLVDAYLDHAERHVLVAHCAAYVSLHRAEGLGLTVAEAMAWGKPVVTTDYGGVTQFCTDDNALLVRWSPSRVGRTVGPYTAGLPWAEPNLDHAAELMRWVVDEPDRAAALGARAARDIATRHSADAAGIQMRRALDEGDHAWRAARRAARAQRRSAAEAAALAVHHTAAPSSAGSGSVSPVIGGARAVWRRSVRAAKARAGRHRPMS